EEVGRRPIERPEGGLAHGREGRRVGLAVAGREVGLERVVLAFGRAVAGGSVGIEDVAGPGVGRHPDLRTFSAFRTRQWGDDGRAVDALADVGQEARVDEADLRRPAGAEVWGG